MTNEGAILFPGYAWEHPALEALPRNPSSGREAEPDRPGVPRWTSRNAIAPRRHGIYHKTPATQAVMWHASVPPIIARRPSLARSARRPGTSEPIPPI